MSFISKTSNLSPAFRSEFDEIIDVRSPSEFAEDHIPSAINLPVLDDGERHTVGTVYVQKSRFKARRIGAAMVARNVAGHLDAHLADKPQGYRPLVYCWRGGMRSESMATIMAAVGWRVTLVEGGYQTWRRICVSHLIDDGPVYPVVLIDGQTGSAKTWLLEVLGRQGAQVLNLEALAEHRGSVFGAMSDQQPAQKMFESRLWDALSRLDPERPVLLEAESPMIGRVRIPKRLLNSMRCAPRIEIRAPREARARYLVEAYRDLVVAPERLESGIERLRSYHSGADMQRWLDLARRGDYMVLAAALTEAHYDPLYDRHRAKRGDAPVLTVPVERLDAAALDAAAARILQHVDALNLRGAA